MQIAANVIAQDWHCVSRGLRARFAGGLWRRSAQLRHSAARQRAAFRCDMPRASSAYALRRCPRVRRMLPSFAGERGCVNSVAAILRGAHRKTAVKAARA